jgi:exosortase/archaeosortase family protein
MSPGRTCIGLGLAGQGVALLSGVVPHEDPLVGAGLLAFGLALVATGTLPALPALRRWHLLGCAAVALAATAAAWALSGQSPSGPLLLLALLGVALLAAAPFHGRSLRVRGRVWPVRDLAAGATVALGAPLAVWLAQATFKRVADTTPLEAFQILFLLAPVHWMLGQAGIPTAMDGQTLTMQGQQGRLTVEVGAACSGMQAMALFMGMLALFAAAERPPGRRLALWTVVGLAGVYITNLLRLFVVVLTGQRWGAGALQEVHANAGWAFFVAWSLLFAAWLRRDLQRLPAAAPAASS